MWKTTDLFGTYPNPADALLTLGHKTGGRPSCKMLLPPIEQDKAGVWRLLHLKGAKS